MNINQYGIQETFYGRIDEQERFRQLLDAALQTPLKGILRRPTVQPEWASVVCVHGVGGMGKTTLCKRLKDIASGVASPSRYQNRFNILWLDWESCRDRDPRLAQKENVAFEIVLDYLYIAFKDMGWTKNFEAVQKERSRFNELSSRIESLLSSDDLGERYVALRKLGALGLTTLLQVGSNSLGIHLPSVPQASAHIAIDSALEIGSDALRLLAQEWLRQRLGKDEYELFIMPSESLARSLAKGIRNVSQTKPLIIFLDTYEIVDAVDPWLRLIISQCGTRVIWVLSGRDNLVDSRTRAGAFFRGYQVDAPAERLRSFQMTEFGHEDIKSYFKEKVPTRPFSDQEAALVHQATYGIPLAIQVAAAIWLRGASIESIVGNSGQRANREEIVRQMTARLLAHVPGDSQDIKYLYALALAYTSDYNLLGSMLEADDIEPLLSDLERRYDFVSATDMRLHAIVKGFMQEYLLADVKRSSPTVRGLSVRAIHLLEQRLADKSADLLSMEERLSDDEWTMNALALAWHRYWLNQKSGYLSLRILLFTGLVYNSNLINRLLDIFDFLHKTSSQDTRTSQRIIRTMLKTTYSRSVVPITHRTVTMMDELLTSTYDELESSFEIQPCQGSEHEFLLLVTWLRGLLALRDGDEEEALRLWLDVADQTTDNLRSLNLLLSNNLARLADGVLMKQERYQEALPVLKQACRLNPKAGRPWHTLGHVYESIRDQENALLAFEAACKLDDKQADNWRCVGRCRRQCGHLHEAVKALVRATEIDERKKGDHVAISWYELGRTYLQLKQYELAEQAIHRSISHKPAEAELSMFLGCLGDIYFVQGRMNESIDALMKAAALKGTAKHKGHLWNTLGQRMLESKRVDDAIHAFEQSVLYYPQSSASWHNLGHAFQDKGLLDKAIEAFKQAIFIEPRTTSYVTCFYQVCQQQSMPDQAMGTLLEYVSNELDITRQGHFLRMISRIHREMGDLDRSLSNLERASLLSPSDTWLWIELGELYQTQRQRTKAMEAYRKGLELSEGNLGENKRLDKARKYLEQAQTTEDSED